MHRVCLFIATLGVDPTVESIVAPRAMGLQNKCPQHLAVRTCWKNVQAAGVPQNAQLKNNQAARRLPEQNV